MGRVGCINGCRCDDCTESNRVYFRERRASQSAQTSDPGPVEVAVEAEIAALAGARPGLAQAAIAMARIIDNPKAVNQQPAAAKVLVTLLDKLGSASARNRGGLHWCVRCPTGAALRMPLMSPMSASDIPSAGASGLIRCSDGGWCKVNRYAARRPQHHTGQHCGRCNSF